MSKPVRNDLSSVESSVGSSNAHRADVEFARLSSRIASLFPAGIVAVESRGAGDPAQLHEAERQQVSNAVPGRRQEFAAGRLCARRALAEYGIANQPLLRLHDRRPHWPVDIVGSLTHTGDFCAAVVGRRDQYAGLGLDAETVGRVTQEIWPQICVAPELRWLTSLPKPARAQAATLIFSAKEAFYKCQYNVSRAWLDFSDVQIDIDGSDFSAGQFVIGVVDPQARAACRLQIRTGRFCLQGQQIVAGIAWPCMKT